MTSPVRPGADILKTIPTLLASVVRQNLAAQVYSKSMCRFILLQCILDRDRHNQYFNPNVHAGVKMAVLTPGKRITPPSSLNWQSVDWDTVVQNGQQWSQLVNENPGTYCSQPRRPPPTTPKLMHYRSQPRRPPPTTPKHMHYCSQPRRQPPTTLKPLHYFTYQQ